MRKMLAVPVLMLMAACGGGSSSSPSAPSTPAPPQPFAFTVTIEPNPIIATSSGRGDFPWAAQWTAAVRCGTGTGNLNFVNISSRDRTTGLEFPNVLNYGVDRIISGAGTNHCSSNGQMIRVPMSMVYRGAFNAREVIITATVNGRDDLDGATVNAAGQANII